MRAICLVFLFSFIGIFFACNEGNVQLSEQDYEGFCGIIEEAINQDNHEFLDSIYDTKSLVDQTIAGIDAPKYYSDGFRDGFKKFYTPGTILCSAIDESAYIKFLGMKTMSPPTGLFRIISNDGLNYQEIELGSDETGQAVIKDFYSYKEAELFSQGMRRLYLINLSEEVEDFNHPYADALPVISQSAQLADAGQIGKAFHLLKSLPKEVKEQKIILLMMLNMGFDLGEDSLAIAKDLFKSIYPDDPFYELKMLDFSFYSRDNDKILSAIEILRAEIGQDPYLNVLKAAIFKNKENYLEAEALLRDAIEVEPEHDEAYWLLFEILAKTKKHKESIDLMEIFKTNFDQNAADFLILDAGYDELMASPAFKEWIESNPLSERSTVNIDSLRKAFEEELEHDHSHDGHDHHGHQH